MAFLTHYAAKYAIAAGSAMNDQSGQSAYACELGLRGNYSDPESGQTNALSLLRENNVIIVSIHTPPARSGAGDTRASASSMSAESRRVDPKPILVMNGRIASPNSKKRSA